MKSNNKTNSKQNNSSLNPLKVKENDSFSQCKVKELTAGLKIETKEDKQSLGSNENMSFYLSSHDGYHGSTTHEMTIESGELNENIAPFSDFNLNDNISYDMDDDEKINDFNIKNYTKNF